MSCKVIQELFDCVYCGCWCLELFGRSVISHEEGDVNGTGAVKDTSHNLLCIFLRVEKYDIEYQKFEKEGCQEDGLN